MAASKTSRFYRSLKSCKENMEDSNKSESNEDPVASLCLKVAELCTVTSSGKSQVVSYRNSLSKAIDNVSGMENCVNYSMVFKCLRIPLVSENKAVRSAAVRVIRHLVNKESLPSITETNVHHLLAKCLDINLDNLAERAQVLRFCRKVALINPEGFPLVLARPITAVAMDGFKERDRLVRACLAILAEICVLNPTIFIESGGIQCFTAAVLDCPSARMQESLMAALLFLLNNPEHRKLCGLSLNFLVAPYSDVHYKHSSNVGEQNQNPSSNPQSNEDRELRVLCAKQALLSVLRSWPGLLHFVSCGISSDLVNVLYLPHLETRKAILDLLYTLLRLPLPGWTDEFSVALKATDPSRVQDSWKLQEGFIAAEGKSLLNYISKHRPNLVLNYTALLVYSLMEARLPQALVEVIVTSDTFISVRATVLLGELLHLSSTLTPPACQQTSSCLPSLLECAASKEDPIQRQRAAQAVLALAKLHQLKQRGTVPCSLALRQIIDLESRCSSANNQPKIIEVNAEEKEDSTSESSPVECSQQDIDNLSYLLRDSGVMIHKDPILWNWSILSNVFTRTEACFYKLEDTYYKMYVRRVVQFYKPSSNQYCHCELNNYRTRVYTIVACHLVDFLTSTEEAECQKILSEWLEDISSCIRSVSAAASAHDCLLSPGRLNNTACQDYFLLIGRLSSTINGIAALERAGIFQDLLELVTTTNHDCYLKLSASNLNYEHDGYARAILKKILLGSVESGRIYATLHLRVLLRAAAGANRIAQFCSWAANLLINQLQDSSRAVVVAAADVLDELADSQAGIEALLPMQSTLKSHLSNQAKILGLKGSLLLTRLLAIPAGFKLWNESPSETDPQKTILHEEFETWTRSLNLRYVYLVENELTDGLSQHQRAEDGRYGRLTNAKHSVREIPVPVHLYGQLTQHREGLDFLRTSGHLNQLFHDICKPVSSSEEDVLTLKAALWAAGHLGTSGAGIQLLESSSTVEKIVNIAAQSPWLSLRGTAFFALNLMATTETGAEILAKYGWAAVRKAHGELWNVVNESEWDVGRVTCVKDLPVHPKDQTTDNRLRTVSQSSGYSVTFAAGLEMPRVGRIPEGSTSTPARAEEDPEAQSVTAGMNGLGCVRWETESGPYSLEGSSIHINSDWDLEELPSATVHGGSIEERDRRANTLPPQIRFSRTGSPVHCRSFSDSSYPPDENSTPKKPVASAAESTASSRRFSMETKIWSKLRSSFKIRSSKRWTLNHTLSSSTPAPSRQIESSTTDTDNHGGLEESPDHWEDASPEDEETATVEVANFTSVDRQRLNRIGSALSFLRSAPYKTRPLSADQSNDAARPCYMGLCLPVHFRDLFPDSKEFIREKRDQLQEVATVCCTEEDQFAHEMSTCLVCRGSSIPAEKEDPEERILVRKELLRFVTNLGSSVGYNANEQGLLRLKQKFPWAFQDLCIYSDVCHIIGNYSYRLRARRFIQEMFADGPFQQLYEQATRALEQVNSPSS